MNLLLRRFRYTHLLFLCLLTFTNTFAQQSVNYQLKLRTGAFEPTENTTDQSAFTYSENEVFNGVYFRLVQFYSLPTAEKRADLLANGIKLLDYVPNMTYIAEIRTDAKWGSETIEQLRSINPLDDRFKLHPDLYHHNYPPWAMVTDDELLLNVVFMDGYDFEQMRTRMSLTEAEEVALHPMAGKITIQLPANAVMELVRLPFVLFIEPIDEPAHPENYTGRTLHRSNMISSDLPSGLHYDGTGINVGMHDDGIIGPHIDYEGRIPAQFTGGNGGDHGDHVAGTIMGAGNLDPKHRGMATGANLYVYSSSNNNYDSVPSHYNNLDVVITSKSYSNGCNAGYTSLSRELDRYVRQNTSLMHVFSAGNDGTSNCGYGAGAGWGNITGGHKAGKNVIAVANLNSTDGLANSSSRGPAEDGRIKPDISAKGTSVVSTTDVNEYVSKTGTSMSCPGVSGSLAQLYHAYRDLNGGSYPASSLIKGVVLNTADDLGNPGPDFRYGWGRINNAKAYEVIEKGQYVIASLDQNDSNFHDITVPANVKQLKVMVYWNDYEASSSASTALVNNLDFTLDDPASTTFLPWVLDPTPNPANLNANAVRGIDDLNNVEQVTIDNPAAGVYTAKVKGKIVPQGPQEYTLVYAFLLDEITVTYPNGGESVVPGEVEMIRWDAAESPGVFNIEYSIDNGGSWNFLAGVVGTRRYYSWVVPSALDGERALIRVSGGGNTDDSDTSFSILGVPSNLQVEWSCPDSIKLSWNATNLATSYEVSRLGNKYMDSIGTSSITSFVVKGIQPTEEAWFSVKALGVNNTIGRRAIAIERPLGTFGCPIPDDASVVDIVNPVATVSQCKSNTERTVSVIVKNEGVNSVSNIPVSYSIGGGTPVTETMAGPLASGASQEFTFTTPADLSPLGNLEVVAWTSLPGDGNFYNDSTLTTLESFGSAIVTLPYSEDFESFNQCGIANNCGGTTCPLQNDWLNHANGVVDDMDWRTDRGGTRSDDTGPEADHNPGTSTGNYLYTEVSGSCSAQMAYLISPCIDLSTAVEPELSYWYHMFGSDMGSMHLDVLHQNEWVLDVKVNAGDNGDQWLENVVDLSAFTGDTINLRFRGISADGPFGDMAIDDISLIETFTGIDEALAASRFSIHPNPSAGTVELAYPSYGQAVQLSIASVQGRVIAQQQLPGGTGVQRQTIDLSDVAKGVYVVRLTANGNEWMQKLVLY
jgi:hypothetical protein